MTSIATGECAQAINHIAEWPDQAAWSMALLAYWRAAGTASPKT